MYHTRPELLVPAGDSDCLRAGVQNGADAIYFGSNLYSARASAKNFSLDEMQEAINYCKLRNVKTYLTLNTLLTDSEFENAVSIAKSAYKFGIDAIIVQDLGFGKFLIDNFPGLAVHASTQMSVHNLEGVLTLQNLGFKRVVLARELSLNEIEFIRKHCEVEIEVFVHGALCISYSGQCLFSSLVGGRSGNRGKCAQPCRLPYDLIEENKKIESGYLLSPRDLCSLDHIPSLIESNINSFKIEGRMKTPDYVAAVTQTYRKYIDTYCETGKYSIDPQDQKKLLQVFNRGGFSSGHLDNNRNKDLIFPEKQNNMGLYLGNISNYNSNKGHIKIHINESISIGDTLSIEGETGVYTVSEIIMNNQNLSKIDSKNLVVLGRMKGKIKVGVKVYKLSSKPLNNSLKETYKADSNLKKIPINFSVYIKRGQPIQAKLTVVNQLPFYTDICIDFKSDIIPEASVNSPITRERVIEQFSKLGNTPYYINNFDLELDDSLHIPHISDLNNIRRTLIEKLESEVISISRPDEEISNSIKCNFKDSTVNKVIKQKDKSISLLLEKIDLTNDYSKLKGIERIYIPIKYFADNRCSEALINLSRQFKLYVYMPTIIKTNYKNLIMNDLDEIVKKFHIAGFVISNYAGFSFLEKYINKFEIISNYTMNVFNTHTINELKKLGVTKITPSVELSSTVLEQIISNSSLPVELIAYGRSILMNSSYCLLGKTNKCYPECDAKCKKGKKYYLKDRLGFMFRIIPDNVQTVTSIYNSKITSIDTKDFNVSSIRVNIVDENVDEINSIIETVKKGIKIEGQEYTNGNLNRTI